MESPLWGRGRFVLDRNEGSCVSLSLLGLFLLVVTALEVLVTIWVSVLVGSRLCTTDDFSWCYALSPSGCASSHCLWFLFAPGGSGVVSWWS